MRRPVLIDLFCGAGGASKGYSEAGYEVIGVDKKFQPNYPGKFIHADWIEGLIFLLNGGIKPDVIHASPPCQTFTRGQKLRKGATPSTPDLLEPVRSVLTSLDSKPTYIIENVVGAPLINPLMLCGSMFNLKVRRHRLFESNALLLPPGSCKHKEQGKPVGVYHAMNDQVQGIDHTTGRKVLGGRTARNLQEGQDAMGIDWMTWPELREAVPPAYTKWIGQFIIGNKTVWTHHVQKT